MSLEHALVTSVQDGRALIERPGFSYLPGFISKQEAAELIAYFAELQPLWEQRHRGATCERNAAHSRRLTRPVYWLGGWQFACLGYYAEPSYRDNRCVRAEPFPAPMLAILDRMREPLLAHGDGDVAPALPNTCLINYYGRNTASTVPRDYARLRMHRDHEPGPVLMFSIGQPALLEFLDPERSATPELALWLRHRSVCILSGRDFKDRLYHRVTKVRTGALPAMSVQLPDFELRRVSVSFRSVPEPFIKDLAALPDDSRALIADYVDELAERSTHWRDQLRAEVSAQRLRVHGKA